MIERTLGAGVAPDCAILNGVIHVAFGAVPNALTIVRLSLDGTELGRETLPNGFDQSFPRFSGPWLLYRQDEAHGFSARVVNVATGLTWGYGAAGGTYGLTCNESLGLGAWEWAQPGQPWRIYQGSLTDGSYWLTGLEGAPDGLDRILSAGEVSLRKDTRGDVAGIWYPVRAGSLVVGELRDEPERPNGGIGLQLDGDALRMALQGQNTPDPRCATDGTVYAICCWNPVRVLIGTEAEIRALPPADRKPGPIVPIEPPEPVDPPVEPVDPPIDPPMSESPYASHKVNSMETKTVVLRGPGGKFGRADAENTGPWGHLNKGWRGLIWDVSDAAAADQFEMTMPDTRHQLKHLNTGGLFGVDPTVELIANQFYLTPPNQGRGWAESPVIYDQNVSGVIGGWVEFDHDPTIGKFVSCGFAVEVV